MDEDVNNSKIEKLDDRKEKSNLEIKKKTSSVKTQQNLADYSQVVWSSAKIMHYMISSQMTHTKINMN